MDFTARSDVEAPLGYVFDQFSDFAGFETAALRRGAEVVRVDNRAADGPGMQWRATFPYGGKPRRMMVTLEAYSRPGHMRFELESKNVAGEMIVDLHALSPGQTRVQLKIRLKPLTMTARVLLQTLRLAKARTVRRLHDRMELHSRAIENRYRGPA